MPEETRAKHGKKSRATPKPFEVWYRAPDSTLFFKDWCRFGKYKDEATAQEVIRQKRTDPYFEYEIRNKLARAE